MLDLDESQLIERIKKGDVDAFSKIFEKYYAVLCYFSAKYLKDLDLSRSLVQQFFIDLWLRHEKLSVTHSLKSYLYTSVKNRSIDYLRSQKSTTSLKAIKHEESVSVYDKIAVSELNASINTAINQLPEKCRNIFILSRFDGLKYGEIAQKLNISVKTVEMQMSIALKKLRSLLSDYQMISLMVMFFSKKREE